ncbi:midnolin [Esox lucius]|uniref:Ubiquitin-like domain-containing protein n=1 Tax=Esox lucius TaxID=8010 RepID=A0A3P8XWA1_ESOLU|nr:midnolin [Esox lucius]
MDHQPVTLSFVPRGDSVCLSVPLETSMRLSISSTTGSGFELSVHQGETVEVLRRRISQKLRVPKERFVLLHKETQLSSGKLQDVGLVDGSKLTLVPAIEAGLSSQPSRTKQTIMQALESLTETQVNDFLSGRLPLTLALRVGDHIMFVQLQLSPQNIAGPQQRPLNSRSTNRAEQVHPGKSGSTRFPYSRPHPSLFFKTPGSQEKASPATLSPDTPSSTSHVIHPPHTSIAPTSSTHPTYSSPGPRIPTPATTCPEGGCSVAGPPTSRKPGSGEPAAVIESLVSHAPGVFSGTFSGTLPPACQDSSRSSRRGINTILQILNDLLSATQHHQRAPMSLSQLRCPPPTTPTSSTPNTPTSPSPPLSPLTPDAIITTTPEPLMEHINQEQGSSSQTSGLHPSQSENQVLRCKLERLQILMHQKRLRRRARRDTRTSHPYPPHHRKPWYTGPRKASARQHSNDSLSSSEGSCLDDMEIPWKPELPSDLVMA